MLSAYCSSCAIALVAAFAVVAFGTHIHSDSWPMVMHDPQNTLTTQIPTFWSNDTTACPLFAGFFIDWWSKPVLYTPSQNPQRQLLLQYGYGIIQAFDLNTHVLEWSFTFYSCRPSFPLQINNKIAMCCGIQVLLIDGDDPNSGGYYATEVGRYCHLTKNNDDTILYVTSEESIAAYTSDLDLLWSKNTSSRFKSPVVVDDDGSVFVGSDRIQKFSKHGTLLWDYYLLDFGVPFHMSLDTGRHYLLVATMLNTVQIIDSRIGENIYTYILSKTHDVRGVCPPTLDRRRNAEVMYVTRSDGAVEAVNLTTFEQLWLYSDPYSLTGMINTIVDGNGHAFTSTTHALMQFDLDGNQIWMIGNVQSNANAFPVVANDGSLISSYQGAIYALKQSMKFDLGTEENQWLKPGEKWEKTFRTDYDYLDISIAAVLSDGTDGKCNSSHKSTNVYCEASGIWLSNMTEIDVSLKVKSKDCSAVYSENTVTLYAAKLSELDSKLINAKESSMIEFDASNIERAAVDSSNECSCNFTVNLESYLQPLRITGKHHGSCGSPLISSLASNTTGSLSVVCSGNMSIEYNQVDTVFYIVTKASLGGNSSYLIIFYVFFAVLALILLPFFALRCRDSMRRSYISLD